MCGIAGAIDLKRSARVSRQPAAGDDRRDRPPRARRRADPSSSRASPWGRGGCRSSTWPGGRQPISNEDGSIWVTQNGEIFEYPELQHELLARGHRLATRCDTELWVHLYEDLGEGFFEKTRGQFAVALWDRKNRTVILGRDRVGICPLYYTEADGWLLWGSEIKALLASGLVDARPDPKGIDLFFNTFCAGTTRTFFEGIKIDSAGPFSADSRRPGRAQTVLGPRFSRCRQRATARRPDARWSTSWNS